MTMNKKHIIAQRRGRVSQLYLQGRTQPEIAEVLNCSQSQVSRDLKHLTQIWKLSAMEDLSEKKAKDLQELEMIKRQLWDAWNRSKEARKETRIKGRLKSEEETPQVKEQSVKKTESLPDPRYMAELLRTLKQISELLGYNAATKLDVSFDQLTDSQVDDILNKLIDNGK